MPGVTIAVSGASQIKQELKTDFEAYDFEDPHTGILLTHSRICVNSVYTNGNQMSYMQQNMGICNWKGMPGSFSSIQPFASTRKSQVNVTSG